MTALAVFDAALRRAGAGHPTALTLRDDTGGEHRLDPGTWCCDDVPGDGGLLDRCTGPTLDVGCGPGRLAAALTRRGRPTLGIDVSATAVRLARRRGAVVLLRNVFDPLPGHGRWQRLLLADGNIGIGGDPYRLLSRSRDLIAPTAVSSSRPPRPVPAAGRAGRTCDTAAGRTCRCDGRRWRSPICRPWRLRPRCGR